MNAIELHILLPLEYRGATKPAGIFYCEKCRTVSTSRKAADECCLPYHCQICGIEMTEHRLICRPCSDKKSAAKEQAKFEAAEKVLTYDGPVWIPNSSDSDWYHTRSKTC